MSVRRKQIADGVEKGTPKEEPSPLVMTIGHSTRTREEFIEVLQTHGVSCVVDLRTVPRSRHNPQFNKTSLPRQLKVAGLGYVHLPGLGGLRHATRDSLNVAWGNASLRGYADYMQTPKFAQTLDELVQLANQGQIVLMCAEAVPWRCHRSFIADALLVRGIHTEDIMSPTRRQVHALTPFPKSKAPRLPLRPRLQGARKRSRRPSTPGHSPSRKSYLKERLHHESKHSRSGTAPQD